MNIKRIADEFLARSNTIKTAEDFEAMAREFHVTAARDLAEHVALKFPVPANDDPDDPPFVHCLSMMQPILETHREAGMPPDATARIRSAANNAYWARYAELVRTSDQGGSA